MTTSNLKTRYQVSGTYLELIEGSPYRYQHPRILGYYDAYSADAAFKMFLSEHAPDVRRAQIFYEDIIVVPVPDKGFKYSLRSIYGDLAKFPNQQIVEELSHDNKTN